MSSDQSVTVLLHELAGGERQAFDKLIPLVYPELRRIAEVQLWRERSAHTLQPTALVNELYARMVGQEQLSFNDRAHFLSVAAHTMRKVLIDYARMHHAAKRDFGREKLSLEAVRETSLGRPSILIALDDVLNTLERQDPLLAQLIELRYFGGLTLEESAVAVNLSVGDVRRELQLAEAWLRRELESSAQAQGKSRSIE
ncbi:MAG: sigma-70 family RNA polymerase sigma factor [Acidobacteriia bacterium]|nr:sigma-70 family RNA polymerase sigma factor [Terriglobia bacterium]